MRLIFWFLVAANVGFLILRYGVGVPEVFREPALVISVDDQGVASVAKVALLSEVAAPVPVVSLEDENGHLEENGKPQCRWVGPFEASSLADGFVSRLAALDVSSKVNKRQISAGAGFWVYLEPLDNRKRVRQKLLDLQGRGIDCYIIPRGNLANGISLGMFSRLDLANNRILELRKMGYEAKTQKIERSYEESWVALGPGEDQKIGSSAWKMLLKGKKYLKEEENVCLGVASQ